MERLPALLFNVAFTFAISSVVRLAFALYNGVIGIAHRSIWNGSISLYYLLFSGVGVWIVRTLSMEREGDNRRTRRVFFWSHIAMFGMNLSLIVPVIAMLRGKRVYAYGLIPAIAIAAYTTYRIVSAAIWFKRTRRNGRLLVSELRTIRLIDALVAVLTLQDTMIQANGGMTPGIKKLAAGTSTGLLALIVIITALSFLRLWKPQ